MRRGADNRRIWETTSIYSFSALVGRVVNLRQTWRTNVWWKSASLGQTHHLRKTRSTSCILACWITFGLIPLVLVCEWVRRCVVCLDRCIVATQVWVDPSLLVHCVYVRHKLFKLVVLPQLVHLRDLSIVVVGLELLSLHLLLHLGLVSEHLKLLLDGAFLGSHLDAAKAHIVHLLSPYYGGWLPHWVLGVNFPLVLIKGHRLLNLICCLRVV